MLNQGDITNSKRLYDSTMAPFFRQYIDNDIDDIKSESIIPETDITSIDTIDNFNTICNSKEIKDFYINNSGIDREIYLKSGHFFLLKKYYHFMTI